MTWNTTSFSPFTDWNALYCTRRQFLQSVAMMCGVLPWTVHKAFSASPMPLTWVSLETGQIYGQKSAFMGPPGSLMKLVTSAALVEDHLLNPDERLTCQGSLITETAQYTCLKPHGPLHLVEAIGHSCNVFFATASQRLSPTRWRFYAEQFGLNQSAFENDLYRFPKTLSEPLQRYALGLDPTLQTNSFQLLRLCCFIAHAGQPFKAKHPQPKQAFTLTPAPILSPSSWEILRQGMRGATRYGTAKQLDPNDTLRVAAKTGTAMHGKTFQSWVIGYFPFEAPRIAFCVRAFSGTSQDRAIPTAQKLLSQRFWEVTE